MVYGYSATASGLLLIPMVVGLTFTATVSGRMISKLGRYKGFVIAGLVVIPAGVFLMSTLDADAPLALVCTYLAVLGLGMGLIIQNLTLAVQNAFPQKEVGTATSSNNFFREIGATVATAAVGAMFSDRLTASLSDLGAAMGGGSTESLTPALVKALPEAVHDQVVNAYTDALLPIFAGLAAVALIGLVLSFFLPNQQLRDDDHQEEDRTPAMSTSH